MSFVNNATDVIVKDIIREQTMNGGISGSKLKVTGTDSFVILYKRVTLFQLRNWRKQYLSIIGKQQIAQDKVPASFVAFLNTQLKEYVVCEKKRVSEAGNRTPVVRVTGGNTKPLYYFGPVKENRVE